MMSKYHLYTASITDRTYGFTSSNMAIFYLYLLLHSMYYVYAKLLSFFHFISADVMESDDLRLVSDEVDKTHNYKKKVRITSPSL